MRFDQLKKNLAANQSERLAKEQKERSDKPRHTVYKGDRTIQQLGDQPIENSVVLNNQSLAIGDVMLPLAKGNVLRRVDNTNGGALLGSAYRDALENDFDANGRRRGSDLGRNGGLEPSDPSSTNRPRRRRNRFPPPFGCTPPPPTCFWSNNPVAPEGFQGYGSAVVNENGVPLYLYCIAGTSVPNNLNCSFLDPQRWRCQNGVCLPDANGVYTSKAQCEAALIPPPFGIPIGSPIGWYEKLVWTNNYNATGGISNILISLLSPSPLKTDSISLGGDCGGRGGKTRLVNGSPFPMGDASCMTDNIFNPLVSAEWAYWDGGCP